MNCFFAIFHSKHKVNKYPSSSWLWWLWLSFVSNFRFRYSVLWKLFSLRLNCAIFSEFFYVFVKKKNLMVFFKKCKTNHFITIILVTCIPIFVSCYLIFSSVEYFYRNSFFIWYFLGESAWNSKKWYGFKIWPFLFLLGFTWISYDWAFMVVVTPLLITCYYIFCWMINCGGLTMTPPACTSLTSIDGLHNPKTIFWLFLV